MGSGESFGKPKNQDGQLRNERLTDSIVKVKTIEDCDFPIVEKVVEGKNVVAIPPGLLKTFNEEGVGAIRINSASIAARLPDYGGGTAVGRSQVPHQDHAPTDPRRFLAFSKPDPGPRGSETYVVHPETMRKTLPWLIEQFEAHREELRQVFVYNPPYMVTKEELYRCFEPEGLKTVIEAKLGKNTSEKIQFFGTAGLLTYLLQGDLGDELVEQFLKENDNSVFREKWETQGTLIVDNSNFFHGRRGPNVRLKRNWMVEQ